MNYDIKFRKNNWNPNNYIIDLFSIQKNYKNWSNKKTAFYQFIPVTDIKILTTVRINTSHVQIYKYLKVTSFR